MRKSEREGREERKTKIPQEIETPADEKWERRERRKGGGEIFFRSQFSEARCSMENAKKSA